MKENKLLTPGEWTEKNGFMPYRPWHIDAVKLAMQEYAEYYHEQKLEQRKHLEELTQMGNGEPKSECFNRYDLTAIFFVGADYDKILNHLNTRAAEFAAGKVVGMFTEDQLKNAMRDVYDLGGEYNILKRDEIISQIKGGQ